MADSTSDMKISNETKTQVLLAWKKAYLKALIEALQPSGKFLQIGYSKETVSCLHPYKIETCTLIEKHPDLAKEALLWAGQDPSHCQVIQESWETALPTLQTFDTIFFGEYSDIDDAQTINYLFSEELLEEINKTRDLLNQLGDEMAKIKVQYSDEDLENFYNETGQFNRDKLGYFFHNLLDNGHITQEQFKKVAAKYGLQSQEIPQEPFLIEKASAMQNCLEECLKHHMEEGSRFVGFSNGNTSKYDDSLFAEKIISNPDVDYSEKVITLEVLNKKYEALIFIVEKRISS